MLRKTFLNVIIVAFVGLFGAAVNAQSQFPGGQIFGTLTASPTNNMDALIQTPIDNTLLQSSNVNNSGLTDAQKTQLQNAINSGDANIVASVVSNINASGANLGNAIISYVSKNAPVNLVSSFTNTITTSVPNFTTTTPVTQIVTQNLQNRGVTGQLLASITSQVTSPPAAGNDDTTPVVDTPVVVVPPIPPAEPVIPVIPEPNPNQAGSVI